MPVSWTFKNGTGPIGAKSSFTFKSICSTAAPASIPPTPLTGREVNKFWSIVTNLVTNCLRKPSKAPPTQA